MACDKCENKGYIVISTASNNKFNSVVKTCPHCNDVKAYSDYVKAKYSSIKKEDTVKEALVSAQKDLAEIQDCLKGKSPLIDNVIPLDSARGKVIDFVEYKRKKGLIK